MRTDIHFVGEQIVLENSSRLEKLKTKIKELKAPALRSLRCFQAPKTRPAVTGHEYLLGLRGFLVLQCFVWVFLQTFAPTAVKDAANDDGPAYQQMLRKTLSVLFWNESLLYSFFILLSARTLCIPFFADPSKSVVASAVFRRGLRLYFPVAVSLAVTTLIFASLGLGYIDDFKTRTGNVSFGTPYFLSNAVIYFNSVYNLFWTTTLVATQSGALAFPSQTLWVLNVVYQQSFTVFMVMVAVPYTRAQWRWKMALAFIMSAWWVQSWAWYSVTGMFLADAVAHMDFRARARAGIKIPAVRRWRLPAWVPAAAALLAGLAMQYVWTAARPDLASAELHAHTSLYTSDDLVSTFDPRQPQARADNYLVIVSWMVLLEMFAPPRAMMENRVFVYLGTRSLSMRNFAFCSRFGPR